MFDGFFFVCFFFMIMGFCEDVNLNRLCVIEYIGFWDGIMSFIVWLCFVDLGGLIFYYFWWFDYVSLWVL